MNIVYNASAGTGKTYQVTSLYERLVLEENVDPRDILLMTFTENAAAELRARVAARLLKARRDAEAAGDFEAAERAIEAMAGLPSATIGTIHSFCSRLLREHALEIGLSPSFAVLTGDDYDELLERVRRDELLRQLDTDPDFRAFCEGVQVIGAGGGFGVSVTETVSNLIAEAGSLGVSLEHAERMLPAPEPPVSIHAFENVLNDLQAIAKKTKKISEAMRVIAELLAETDEAAVFAERFGERFKGHFSYGEAKEIYPRFKELRIQAVERERYRERFPAARAFARYAKNVATKFAAAKREADAVDFDDLLTLSARLLATGKARTAFSHVIVDEVQDTSRVQCDLILALWNEDVKLVICGDKKQSIYTWRGADPDVMPDLERAILDREDGTLENLRTSYRSKAPIIDVVNALFTSVYGPETYAEGDQLLAHPDYATENEKSCVEFLQFDGDDELDKRDKVAMEMEAVANRVRLLVEGSDEWRPAYRFADGFEPATANNAYRYSDVLVLLRRTTHQAALESAFRHAGVPYTLGGKGRGLFTRPETRDVSLFLNAVTNPQDVYALVGFMRSPWVGLSDEEIAERGRVENEFSASALVERGHEVVDRYRARLGSRLASELVRELIEETRFDAMLAGQPRGAQRLANLRKVLDWLREIERGARVTPLEVARELAEHVAHPPQVPEAALLDPNQNAVTIMTTHGSKGLTKRVVIAPDTNFSATSDKGFARVYLDEEGKPRIGVRVAAANKSKAESPGFKEANERARAVANRESDNLLYVALTRARDLVVTSATLGVRANGWYKQLEPLIGERITPIPYSDLSAATSDRPIERGAARSAREFLNGVTALPTAPDYSETRRISATRLAAERDEQEPDGPYEERRFRGERNSAALGSLGHAVLEHLSLNDWNGSVGEQLERARVEFGATKAEAKTLEPRVEQTRDLMIELTANATTLRPELPFLLHDKGVLIDGTIDLLCETAEGVALFDYKFTTADDAYLIDTYREQMRIYHDAAKKLYPEVRSIAVSLVAISPSETRLAPVEF